MGDDSLMLNLTSGRSGRAASTSFPGSDLKPLIKFVSKPKLTIQSEDNTKRPAFRVLRKKASDSVKKTTLSSLSQVNFNQTPAVPKPSDEQSTTNIIPKTDRRNTAFSKTSRSKNGGSKARKQPSRRIPNSKWTVSESEQKPPGVQNSTIISSLFRKNPAIPVVEKTSVETAKENVFSSRSFSDLNIHPHLVATLEKDLEMEHMTEAQCKTIPLLLAKKDVLVKSQTGSGKTLAYAIPIVEKLHGIRPKIDRTTGVLALVVVPTRELVLQTHASFVKILKPFTWVVPGYLIGGEKKKSEKARIRKGINVLVSTPGRLLDHLSSTKNLNLGRLHWLVMDEADRLLDMGYEKDVAKILATVDEHFEKEGGFGKRQTVLVSATLSAGVEKLAGLTLNEPERVNMSDEPDAQSNQSLVIPSNLKQSYIVVPAKLRLVSLAAFILWKCTDSTQRKMLIFMTTQDMVDYHSELFSLVLGKSEGATAVKFHKLHGSMAQKDRTAIFKEFRDADSGVLLCTDVAARGLDLPSVDWIVQYNAPVSAEDYVHRVGRTARVGKCGQALLFLAPAEAGFVQRLAGRGVAMTETSPDVLLKSLLKTYSRMSRSMEEAATGLQLAFEESVNESFNLYQTATKGYVSFVRSYAALPKDVRDVFNFQELHLGHYAKSFALRDPPAQINSAGRATQRNDKKQRFSTARERNPQSAVKKRPAPGPGASAKAGVFGAYSGADGEASRHQPTFRERRHMVSEFASGLDYKPPAAKKPKRTR